VRTLLGRSTFVRAVSVCGIAAAATVLVASNAYADTTCAYFTLAQPNWAAGGPGPHTWNSSAIILNFQSDGNLVIYLRNSNGTEGAPVWASGTAESELTAAGLGDLPVTQLDWSAAGEIFLEDTNGGNVCTIGINGALAPGGSAVLQDDGNFVFYNTSHVATWAISGGFHDYGTNYCGATGQL
jgi:hypothetical protein